MDDQRSSVNFDSAAKWPFKLRGKHYLPTRGFSKSPFSPRRIAAMTCACTITRPFPVRPRPPREVDASRKPWPPRASPRLPRPASFWWNPGRSPMAKAGPIRSLLPSPKPSPPRWRQMNRRGCRIWGVGKQCICLAQTHRAGMGDIPGRTLDVRRGRGARATSPAGSGQLRRGARYSRAQCHLPTLAPPALWRGLPA